MFIVNPDLSIHITRGDIASIEVSAKKPDDEYYIFKIGDVVQFNVFEKKNCDNIVLQKDVMIAEESTTATIMLGTTDTRIGEMIHKPMDYWYEVVINPDTAPQTIVGYDSDGPKIFRLFPEGAATP